jgi:hypothetical protein
VVILISAPTLGGHFHSFVYADYGVSREEIVGGLSAFRGYELLGMCDVRPAELHRDGARAAEPWKNDPTDRDRISHLPKRHE